MKPIKYNKIDGQENKKFGKDLLLINIPIAKIKMLSIMPSLEEAPE